MVIKYRILNDPDDTDWKIFDTVELLKLNPILGRSMTQEAFDAMELSHFQKYSDRGRLTFKVIG